jgi:hypothetical protein
MADSATYRRFAEECKRLAATASENDRNVLLEHAATWLRLAVEAEEHATKNLSNRNSATG